MVELIQGESPIIRRGKNACGAAWSPEPPGETVLKLAPFPEHLASAIRLRGPMAVAVAEEFWPEVLERVGGGDRRVFPIIRVSRLFAGKTNWFGPHRMVRWMPEGDTHEVCDVAADRHIPHRRPSSWAIDLSVEQAKEIAEIPEARRHGDRR